jgi:actin-like ATPase involved in cell morphogenesis
MKIGIDIGTSFSSVAFLNKDGSAECVKPGTELSYSVPSAVCADENAELHIGGAAIANKMKYPDSFIDNFKRDFGTDMAYCWYGKEFTPESIYTAYFRYFRESVERHTEQKIDKAYITHPVGYSEQRKFLLKRAASYAGLNEVELLDEPTAAALSYFANNTPKAGEILLVYDLGGGTLDLTLAKITDNGFQLLTEPIGDNSLGGVDFDSLLKQELIDVFSKENDLSAELKKTRFAIRLNAAVVETKKALSGLNSAFVSLPFGSGGELSCDITRERFNELISGRIAHSCGLIKQIIENAGLKTGDIDRVLCVGGSSRIPYVIEQIAQTVGKPVSQTADPELAVCMGAALKDIVKPYQAPMADEQNPDPSDPAPSNVSSMSALFLYAEQGDADAQFNLGTMYFDGIGTNQSYEESHKWFLKSAHQGNADAQYKLGTMYHNGEGLNQNTQFAVFWFQKAAQQEHKEAEKVLETIMKEEEEKKETEERKAREQAEKERSAREKAEREQQEKEENERKAREQRERKEREREEHERAAREKAERQRQAEIEREKNMWTDGERKLVGNLPMELQRLLAAKKSSSSFIRDYMANHAVTEKILKKHKLLPLQNGELPIFFIPYQPNGNLGLVFTNKRISFSWGITAVSLCHDEFEPSLTPGIINKNIITVSKKYPLTNWKLPFSYIENYIVGFDTLINTLFKAYR